MFLLKWILAIHFMIFNKVCAVKMEGACRPLSLSQMNYHICNLIIMVIDVRFSLSS